MADLYLHGRQLQSVFELLGQFSRRLNRAARLEHQRAIITAEALGLFSGEKLGRV